MFFIGSLGWKQKEEIFIEQIKHKKVEEKYAAYRQLHPENPELDDYDIMEEEIYRWLFKTIDELPPRCKKIFLLHLDGKKQRDGGNVSFWGFKIKKNQFYFTHFYSFPVFIMSSLLPNKRSILFVGFRRKNNGQMIMDNRQLLETTLPLNKEKWEKKTRIKSLTINTIYPILRVYCFIVD